MNQPSRLTRDLLVKQFIISRSGRHLPDDWPRLDRAGWSVATHPSDGLPIVDVIARCGSRVGWLIGFGVDLEAGLVSDHLGVPAEAADADFATAFERRVYELGGRYLAVLLVDGVARVYPDPCGSLAAVYSDRFEIVCSTTELLPEDEGSENRELADALDIPNRDNWYPFGLTPRVDAWRLEPNHYLDLRSWEAVRHWPESPLVSVDPGEAARRLVEEIADTAGAIGRHLSDAGPLTASLTAGRDSRMLLACLRQSLDRVEFFTEAHRDRMGRIDCQIAARIARRHGLSHRVVAWENASDEELETWQYRSGRCVAGRTWLAARTARMSGAGGFKLLGIGAEIGRAYYWRLDDIDRAAPEAEEVVALLRLPPVPEVLERAQLRLSFVLGRSFPAIMDLMYLEQRVGCWAAPQLYGHVGSRSDFFGLNHRSVVEGLLRLPAEARAGDQLARDLITSRWPELLDWPFNEFVGPRGMVDRAIRRARRFYREHPRIGRILRRGR